MRCVAILALVACGDASGGATFAKRVIDPAYRSDGVTYMDVDHDGYNDLITAQMWYAGPDFAARHEVRTPQEWDPMTGSSESGFSFALDVDGDTFADLVYSTGSGGEIRWCRNPRGEDVHWECYVIVDHISGETVLVSDVLGEGELHIVLGVDPDERLGWLVPTADPTQPWRFRAITGAGFPQAWVFEHGLGVADLNRDLRADVITGSGWLEQPEDARSTHWPWHPTTISPNNCGNIFMYDVNADGLADLLCTSPHGYGAWWFEELPDVLAPLTFERHVIDAEISQAHAARFVDLDGDFVPELITGRRWWSHSGADPGSRDAALLVYYEMHRSSAGVTWERHVIDDDSGIGSGFEVADITLDGKPDIVVSSRKGLFLFEQQ